MRYLITLFFIVITIHFNNGDSREIPDVKHYFIEPRGEYIRIAYWLEGDTPTEMLPRELYYRNDLVRIVEVQR